MHTTALKNAKRFFDVYLTRRIERGEPLQVVEIGARNVNGSLRSVAPAGLTNYVGVDLEAAPGVDVVLSDPYQLPFATDSIDAIVCSSCFEHAEFFWESFLEIQRVLKPNGLLYLNMPSGGEFHRYPVDCWRFYPDSGLALAKWARAKGYATVQLESYTGYQEDDIWADQVCVFLKDASSADQYQGRITAGFDRYRNGLSYPLLDQYLNPCQWNEDQERAWLWRLGVRVRRRLRNLLQLGHAAAG